MAATACLAGKGSEGAGGSIRMGGSGALGGLTTGGSQDARSPGRFVCASFSKVLNAAFCIRSHCLHFPFRSVPFRGVFYGSCH